MIKDSRHSNVGAFQSSCNINSSLRAFQSSCDIWWLWSTEFQISMGLASLVKCALLWLNFLHRDVACCRPWYRVRIFVSMTNPIPEDLVKTLFMLPWWLIGIQWFPSCLKFNAIINLKLLQLSWQDTTKKASKKTAVATTTGAKEQPSIANLSETFGGGFNCACISIICVLF